MRKVGKCGFLLFLSVFFLAFQSINLDRSAFYKALSGSSETAIDPVLRKLEEGKGNAESDAFTGALRMKKAGFVKGAGNKVKMFKSGALLLEDQIKNFPKNVEYRFLRLSIQEHAPKILKYNKNLDEDKKMIISAYAKMDPDLKKVIKNYASSSKIINQDDLK